ncbi:methylamine utilization protein [Pseudoalteromonas fenneropenaei]|uniref:Methylamine utilization protein n=1 Tax=Pseudoalteromonas fenneropenaei TaxID=1737459 RepID=A0ABV7CP40_9GAMM
MRMQLSRWRDWVCGIALSVATTSYAHTLYVTDAQGAPLAGVVVELVGDTTPAPAVNAIMDQVNQQFQPHVLVITAGQAVSFPNSDDIRHHVYSFSKTKPFELRLYHGTPGAPLTFPTAGVVVLGCNIHDSMVGYIYVAASSATYVSNERGEISLPSLTDTQQLRLWHPQQQIGAEEVWTTQWQQIKQQQPLRIATVAPAPRQSFADKFKGNHAH